MTPAASTISGSCVSSCMDELVEWRGLVAGFELRGLPLFASRRVEACELGDPSSTTFPSALAFKQGKAPLWESRILGGVVRAGAATVGEGVAAVSLQPGLGWAGCSSEVAPGAGLGAASLLPGSGRAGCRGAVAAGAGVGAA
eukprot:11774283-Alexandrium_andersonii.AAC.1